MLPRTTSIWQRDSQPNASDKPGAVHSAIIYTDDRERLASAIEGRSSAKVGAIDETLMRKGATIAIPKPVRTMGVAIG